MKLNKLIDIKKDYLSYFFLIIASALYLYRGIFSNTDVLGAAHTDLRTVFYYTRFFGYTSLKAGTFPFWNPSVFGGIPFVGTLHTAIFYPLNIIFLLLPINLAINWSIFIHLLLSGFFTYLLLKYYGLCRRAAIVGAVIYAFCAPQIMHVYAGHLNVIGSMCWLPLMFLFTDDFFRKKSIKSGFYLSLCLCIQFFAGQPQYLFYSIISLCFYVFFLGAELYPQCHSKVVIIKRTLLFIFFVVFGFLLSSVQIFSTAFLTKHSTRTGLDFAWISSFSLPFQSLITFFVPDFFGDMLRSPYWGKNYLWEMSTYIGIGGFFLAAVSIFSIKKFLSLFVVHISRSFFVFSLYSSKYIKFCLLKYLTASFPKSR